MTGIAPGHPYPFDLTPDEMLAISQDISRHFSPSPLNSAAGSLRDAASGYHFSPAALSEISTLIGRRHARPPTETDAPLTLLPVDPFHCYVYWRNVSLQPDDALILRIFWRPSADPSLNFSAVWFDNPVERLPLRQKIRLPLDNAYYSAGIGRLDNDNGLSLLACSNIIHVPSAGACEQLNPARKPAATRKNGAESENNSAETFPAGFAPVRPDAGKFRPIPENTGDCRQLILHFTDFGGWMDNWGLASEVLASLLQKKKFCVRLIGTSADLKVPGRFRKSSSGQF